MQDYYQQQYSQEELQQLAAQQRAQQSQNPQSGNMNIGNSGNGGVATTQEEAMHLSQLAHISSMGNMIPQGGNDGMDDIITSLNGQRRHSVPHHQQQQISQQYGGDNMGNMYNPMEMRRGMMEFGTGQGDLSNYQFAAGQAQQGRRASDQQLAGDYSGMTGNMDMSGVGGQDFTQIQQTPMHLGTTPYSMPQDMNSNLMGGMMYTGIGMPMHDDQSPIVDFSPSNFTSYSGQPIAMAGDFGIPLGTTPPILHRGSSGHIDTGDEVTPRASGEGTGSHSSGINTSLTAPSMAYPTPPISSSAGNISGLGTYTSPPNHNITPTSDHNQQIIGPPRPPAKSTFQGVYSSSGFDMVGCLMRVAQRKNPEIDIGPVDMSCAFVVCDVTKPDCPIIYVSEIFERLTGYNKHEVLMQNCRFLQSPDGKVMAGVRRRYVDDSVVYALKRRIRKRREVQRTLINYRKGGQAFTNLLTMIPITWDSDEIKYYVGFQVDLVDKPGAVGGKSNGGTFSVNYQQVHLPRYVWQPPDSARARQESGQTISREDVSAVLANYPGCFDSELTRRMWDRLLLENTDDVVHVLSLKGLFLYLSPSSRQVLEFSPSELVGQPLSSVCHPSDIVPVTRELKDCVAGQPVSVVFRIRRKVSGYTWFESHGSLCVEAGKGRKCIILVGRERPVYAIDTKDVEEGGGIGENEIWSKLSTSGMFLFVSSHSRNLLDRTSEELRGTSIMALMRGDSKVEFGRVMERARTGRRVGFRHEVMTRRGVFMMAQTTLYPGDAGENQKPTFLVAQTRLIGKPPRTPAKKNSGTAPNSGDQSQQQPSGQPDPTLTGSGTPNSGLSASTLLKEHVMTVAGGQGLTLGTQDLALSSPSNLFLELQTTRCSSWQFELRQMEKDNRLLAEELAGLLQRKKKRKRRWGKGAVGLGAVEPRECKNCHTRSTPEWRRGPSGKRDLCNSCGLRWAKQVSRQKGESAATGTHQSSEGSSSGASGSVPVGGVGGVMPVRGPAAVPQSQGAEQSGSGGQRVSN